MNDQSDIFPCEYPSTPRMCHYNDRLETFHNWPVAIQITTEQLSEAGFFYMGEHDKVKCFYCNGGLQNWDIEEDAWFEHAKWYPNCEYLLRCKGVEYAQRAASQFPNLIRPSKSNPSPRNSVNDLRPETLASGSVASDGLTFQPSNSSNVFFNNATSTQAIFNEIVNKSMETDVVKAAMGFGFDFVMTRKVIERKLKDSNTEYTSVATLVEDLQQEERFYEVPTNVDEADAVPITTNELLNLCENKENQILTGYSSFEADHEMSRLHRNGTICKQQVHAKLRELRNEQVCKICLNLNVDCLLDPCNHICCCTKCASSIRQCPICRAKIRRILKIYRTK